jgi:methyl acetate hydrolase
MKNALDELLEAGVERGATAGVVAVTVDRDGVTYEGAAGERSIGTGVAMTTDTVGAIFSMTKVITGTAAMQLVEQGRVDLDAPAGQYCPELDTAPMVLEGFDADCQPITRPATAEVTLRNLLTHTSGYVYDIWNVDMSRWYKATGTPRTLSRKIDALKTPLAFDPGTHWEYGIGIDWAGILLERVTGQTLGEYFAEHVTGPLGMTDTAFAHTDSMLERTAAVHARQPDGSFIAIDSPAVESPEYEMGGGDLQSTMQDYSRFLRMILNDGEFAGTQILKPETVATMVANQIGDLRVKVLPASLPHLSNDAEMFTDVDKSWGLSFQIHEGAGETGCSAGTLSWGGLANSYFWIDRATGIGGCYLSQVLPFADKGSIEVFYDLQRTVYNNQ